MVKAARGTLLDEGSIPSKSTLGSRSAREVGNVSIPIRILLDHDVSTLRCKSVEPNLAVLAEIHEAFGVRLQSEWHTVRFRSIALPKEGEMMPRRTVLPTIGNPPSGYTWTLRRVQYGRFSVQQGHMYYLEVSKNNKKIYEANFFVKKDDDPQPKATEVSNKVRKKFS